MNTYDSFLASKNRMFAPTGKVIDASSIHSKLFPFQRDVVNWAANKGRCAILLDTGLGKTYVQLEWMRLIDERTLILAPLSVARQTARMGRDIGIDVRYVRSQDDVTGDHKWWITNYEMLQAFDFDKFGAVVLDECFVPDTQVDTPSGRKYIKDIKRGDAILNAAGTDTVSDVHRREVPYAIRISVNGERITSSPNHPYFTQRGWVGAQDIQPGDSLVPTAQAVRVVRQYVPKAHGTATERIEVLQSILLSEMADETAGNNSEGSFAPGSSKSRSEEERMVCIRQSQGRGRPREDTGTQSNDSTRGEREGVPRIESDAPRTFRAWGQWQGPNGTTEDTAGCTWRGMDSRVCLVTGPKDCGISDLLQARLSESRTQNRYRSGWILTPQSEGTRPEEGCEVGFARVDGLEVLEPGHPDLERYRDEAGHIYFYDLGATQHPSYSINGLLVHNSSLLKAMDGKTRDRLTKLCHHIPYRLCCTATPAPNDYTELGNHAQFLGICSTAEMMSMFFINANKQHTFIVDGRAHERKGSNKGGQEWRLKHHAEDRFFQWLASWAMTMTKPSDLGYDDNGFVLPPLNINPVFVNGVYATTNELFFTGLKGLANRIDVRRQSLSARLDKLSEIVSLCPSDYSNEHAEGSRVCGDQWVIWCGLDDEQRAIEDLLGQDAISIYGSLSPEEKEHRLEVWLSGGVRFLVTKGKVCGFGLNLQCAHHMAFFGLNDSWETYYQCIRRQWRFGQTNPVNVHIIMSEMEDAIYHNVMRKDAMATRLRQKLVAAMRDYERNELGMVTPLEQPYELGEASGRGWRALLGDSCERLAELHDNSIDMSVYSPPFQDLFTYSASDRDLGNCRGADQFFGHYAYIIREVLRVTKPGRLTCVHTSDIPAMQSRDGWIGIKDFPGDVIRAYEREGWTFVGRAFVQKNPQSQAIRVKSKALLFVQLRKDSSDSRPALVDQILLFKKPGDNDVPVNPVGNGEMDNEKWIEWANGIWLGIAESDTLQYHDARGAEDEKHICPLQLGTIERCIKLYSNPGETVLSPFMGIGSEGYQAIRFGRKFIGCELKPSMIIYLMHP